MENVRVKTLDKKIVDGDSSWLLILALVLTFSVLFAAWGLIVGGFVYYLNKLGLVDTTLNFWEALSFGIILLAVVSVITAVVRISK